MKVYILAGQSNMVGIGQVSGSSSRWGGEFIEPVLSVYEGAYDPSKNYDELAPIQTVKLESFGGVSPQKYPGGGTQIVRGQLHLKETGIYEFFPGLGDSRNAIMHADSQEVWSQQPGELACQKSIKLDAGRKVPFKVTYLTDKADGLGWMGRVDIPGTLKTLVHVEGKFPYLLDDKGRFAPRDDVWYKGVVTATANQWLNVGCGANANSIGSVLGFGHMVGNLHDGPVILLKARQGNRSLGWNFLPPGSERFQHTEPDGTTYIYAGYKDRAGCCSRLQRRRRLGTREQRPDDLECANGRQRPAEAPEIRRQCGLGRYPLLTGQRNNHPATRASTTTATPKPTCWSAKPWARRWWEW